MRRLDGRGGLGDRSDMADDARDKQAAEREAKLAQALRDNLRRRKGVAPAPKRPAPTEPKER